MINLALIRRRVESTSTILPYITSRKYNRNFVAQTVISNLLGIMPRPKRPKVVHTVPTLRGVRPTAKPATQTQLHNVSPASSGRVTNATDDSDGLVTTQRTAPGRKDLAGRDEYVMTGALEEGEIQGTRLRPPSTRTIEDVNRIAREAEYASIAADRRKAREVAAANSSDQVQISSTLQPESVSRPASRAGPSAVQSRRPSIVPRGQRTPLAQSSTLGVAMFRKRPRQPSLLQMVQSQLAQSEVEHDEDLTDFQPDDESTPLVKSLTQSRALGTSSSSRQTSGSRKRKLTSPEIQVPASQSEDILTSPSAVLSQPLEHGDASDAAEEPENREPELPSPHASQALEPEIFSDTLAPPQSSSSPPSPPSQRTKTRKASTRQAPNAKTKKQQHPPRHPSTRSPNRTSSTPTSPVRQPLKQLTTAHLQNLLPRRRTHHHHRPLPKGAYDLPSSSDIELDTSRLSENEDELSFHAASKLRRKTKTPAAAMRTLPASRKERAGGPSKANKARNGAAQTSSATQQSKRASRTYTRKESPMISDAVSGAEDEEDEDDSLGPVRLKGKGRGGKGDGAGEGEFDGKAKREMQRLAAKFAEVDDYTLEFEDVTGSSQMADAR